MKENQRILYNHFVKLSMSNNGVIGKNAKKYAEEIDKSFDFSGKKAKAREEEEKAKAKEKKGVK